MKQCTSCKEFKNVSEYHFDKSRKDGMSNRCKKCRCKYDKVIQKQCRACGDLMELSGVNKAQVYCGRTCQELHLKYGVDEYKYEDMLIHQGYKCAICLTEITSKNKNVDHCHKTGHVRGVLCTLCNTALGMMKDDVSKLQRAIEYLNYFEENKPNGIRKEYCGDIKYVRKRHSVKKMPVLTD